MELTGPWEATPADEDTRRTWLDPIVDDPAVGVDWQPIAVPGHWRSTPAFADSDGPLLYRTRLEPPETDAHERLWLRFDGTFYQGDVWLDGSYVGDTEGYFFPHTFEVTDALRERREHTLGI
jgi:beta-mannosidase